MKEFKSNEELIEYLISKNLIINNKEQALRNIKKYSYYSIVNSYKSVFKNKDNNYKPNSSFEEIFALYDNYPPVILGDNYLYKTILEL